MDSNHALLLAVVIPTATVLVGILISNSRINDLGKRIDDVRSDLGKRIR